MKSSVMLMELENALQNGTVLPTSTLAFFATNGSFRVRDEIAELISDRSSVVGALPVSFRLDFWIRFIRESFGRVEGYKFTQIVLYFLWEISNYHLVGEARRMRLQQIITLLEELYGKQPEQRLLIQTDDLVRLFPEVTDQHQYSYSPSFAWFIVESAKVYASQRI